MIKNLRKKLFFTTCFAVSVLTSQAQTGLHFDGSDDYILTDLGGVLGNSPRTVEAWVKWSYQSRQALIVEWGGGTPTENGGPRFTFKIQSSKVRIETGGTNNYLDGSTYLNSSWHHVAVTYDPSQENEYKLYVDGNLDAEGNFTGTGTDTQDAANIQLGGRNVNIGATAFSGTIDDVRIWNVARTQSEILADMNNELCDLPAELVAYYKLNEGTANGSNLAITSVVNEVSSTDVNELKNFALSGNAYSNYAAGKVTSGIDTTITSDDVTLTANQVDAVYQWVDVDNANAEIEGATAQDFTPSESGNYAVEITVGDCTEMSVSMSIVLAEPVFNKRTGLHFDGVDDYVQGTSTPVAGSTARTVEAWIRTTKDSRPASDGGDGQSVICDWGYSSSGMRFTFNLLWSNSIRLETAAGGVSGTTPVNDGTWHHVAAVYDPSASPTVKVFVDGAEDASGNPTVNTSTISKIRLGKRVDGAGLFEGDMDEVRVWNIALTEAQIKSRMNVELCGDETGLVIYYPFGEGTPGEDNTGITTLTDKSTTGDDATLNNFALSGTESNWVEGHGLLSLEGTTLTAVQTNTETTPTELVATYQWVDCDNGNAVIDGAIEQTFTPEVSGNYAVEITVDGCVTTSACMAVDVNALGVDENLMGTLKVFPNPTSGTLNVAMNGVYQTVEAQLVSITGKVVGQYQFNNTNGFELNTNNFNSGLYFLKLKADNMDAVTVKVVKM
ncbi:LamG-like jellyroll fold domain-containing protein [Mangrovimonas xylaniphaga]|uniref:LamG-like jellyroll fold domain-containing protein n=1 Tax=Mangrovimonas xylaniphaga TaxID=1645915 RepID=UPI0006B5C5F3|nr:LamG-like jellyroll fold domain-containing protein [Mangrovimonas xylaniphaga]